MGDISNILDALLVFACTMVNGYDKAMLSINCHRNIKLSAYEVFLSHTLRRHYYSVITPLLLLLSVFILSHEFMMMLKKNVERCMVQNNIWLWRL